MPPYNQWSQKRGSSQYPQGPNKKQKTSAGPNTDLPEPWAFNFDELTIDSVGEAIREYPLREQISHVHYAATTADPKAERLGDFWQEWRTHRASDRFLSWLVEEVRKTAGPQSLNLSPTRAIRAVRTLDEVRRQALGQRKYGLAIAAAKRQLDFMLVCRINEPAGIIATFLPTVVKLWPETVETIVSGIPEFGPPTTMPPQAFPPSTATVPSYALTNAATSAGHSLTHDLPSAENANSVAVAKAVESMLQVHTAKTLDYENDLVLEMETKLEIESEIARMLTSDGSETGMLLYGPPGTGKTALVASVAKYFDIKMLSVTKASLMDMYVGQSEKIMKAIFDYALEHEPCIIYFDEIDAFTSTDHSGSTVGDVKIQLQTTWSQAANDGRQIIVVGSTNNPEQISQPCLRRLPLRYYIGLPTEETIPKLLSLALRKTPHQMTSRDVENLAKTVKGKNLSGDEIIRAVSKAFNMDTKQFSKARFWVNLDGNLYPCKQNTPGAFEGNFRDFSVADKRRCKTHSIDFQLSIGAVQQALARCTTVNTKESLEKLEKWRVAHGN